MAESSPSVGLPAVLRTLNADPGILGMHDPNPAIVVTRSDTSKKYTDFHRLKVVGRSNRKPDVFWLRCIKNKPTCEAQASIEKQVEILRRAFRCFRQLKSAEVELSVCEPIALLRKQQCLITRECRGQLMSRYLLTRLPMLQRTDLEVTFRNVGMWLKSFHSCFQGVGADHEGQLPEGFAPRDQSAFSTVCHCDFSPRNVFVGRNCVEVIDFAGAQPGDAQVDVDFFSRYVGHARFNGLYSRNMKSRLIDAFMDAYSSFVPGMIDSTARDETLVVAGVGPMNGKES